MDEASHHQQSGRPRFAYPETPLATVLVADNAAGVAALLLGNDCERLRSVSRVMPLPAWSG